jgi:hypothetical protein
MKERRVPLECDPEERRPIRSKGIGDEWSLWSLFSRFEGRERKRKERERERERKAEPFTL